MKIWNQAPLVRLILPFIAGILTAIYLPCRINNFEFIIAPYIAALIAIIFIPSFKISYKRSWVFGSLISFLLFALAYQLTISKTEIFSDHHFTKYLSEKNVAAGKVLQSPVEKERSYKVVVEVFSVRSSGKWLPTSGKTTVYISKDERSGNLKYGDEVLFCGAFNEIPPPQNPGEFDYRRFLEIHNVYRQCSVDKAHWMPLNRNSGNFIMRSSCDLRDRLLNVMRSANIKDDEFAVGAALMLGYSDKLDAEILAAYSGTGALHVLSVSGLHVAIVYIVFNWLLFFLDKVRRGNIIKAVILILLLWFYSALTGLSPSVLRAAAMFSFIIIAKTFDRHTNIYNTLAASAFVLLAFNPFLIMDVGFQLSYIAVAGIVFIQPKVHNWLEPGNWLTGQVWTITSVSIAAQIATFPLGLYYFHQFPNYFLLSNLIVIPVSTLIVYLGIALFAFAKISIAATYIAKGFSWSVWFLNASVKTIEKWPCALTDGISITALETWLIYGAVVFFLCYFAGKRSQHLFYTFGFVIALLCSQVIEQQKQYGRQKMIVYDISKTSAIDFINGKSNVLLSDSLFAKNEKALQFHIKNNWWDLGINKSLITSGNLKTEYLNIKNDCIQFNNKKIMIIRTTSQIKGDWNRHPLKIDYLIISGNPDLKIGELLKKFDPSQIIFDSSNSTYRSKKWKNECALLSRPCYCVKDSGAFEVDI